jgi:hypothetical protein
MTEQRTTAEIVTLVRQATSHGAIDWLEAEFLPSGLLRAIYIAPEDAANVRREIGARRRALGVVDVTLANGRAVVCPEVCLSPRSIDETDTLHETRGFLTLTVLDDRGNPRGWVPANAREVLREHYGWSWL